MKKFLIILATAVVLLCTSCTKKIYIDPTTGKEVVLPNSYSQVKSEEVINFELVSSSFFGHDVYKDTITGVLYVVHFGGISPIMEPDGTCLTWQEFTKRKMGLYE